MRTENREERKDGSQFFLVPCADCAHYWLEANELRRLPFLRLLDFGTPPIPQQAAVEHLRRVHGLSILEFAGVGGVWLCGILSGLTFSEGTTGLTFEDKVRNEICDRERLYRLTLDNMRMAYRWLRIMGILTPEGIRAGAIRLRNGLGPTEGAASFGMNMMQVITMHAYRAGTRSVVPP